MCWESYFQIYYSITPFPLLACYLNHAYIHKCIVVNIGTYKDINRRNIQILFLYLLQYNTFPSPGMLFDFFMYIHIHISIYKYRHAYIDSNLFIILTTNKYYLTGWSNLHVRACIFKYTYAYLYINTDIKICTYLYNHLPPVNDVFSGWSNLHVKACIFKYIHIRIHMYIHMYLFIFT
jgi:hypothetical protein